MVDFHVMQVEVTDGYPDIKHLKLRDNSEAVQHFIKMLYRETPREDWGEVDEILQEWAFQARELERALPGGKWVINLDGDKVRAAPCVEPE